MNLTVKRNGGLPSLFSNFFGNSVFDKDLFDWGNDFFPSRLGINVPTANVSETPKEYKLELAAPGLDRKDLKVEIENGILTISAEKEEERKEKEGRSEEHTSELQSLMRISYAVFCLKKKKKDKNDNKQM